MTFRLKSALKGLPLGLMCLGLAACSAAHAPASLSSSNHGTAAASAYNPASGSAASQFLDEIVFPKDKVVDVKITIDPDDFQDMLDNASAEEYKPASVNYNGQQIDNIGIRTKGNLTLRSVVQMSDSDRYSFKLSFNEYVNQTLGGLEKINLNNNYSDASYMREYLAYELAETMGLPTPKYSFVNIYINGELWGFYLAVEQIGTAYLERHFDHAYGALYKGVMTGSGSDLMWLGDDPDLYTGLELKSKSHNGNVLTDMLDELNHGTDYESVIFVEEALKYIALNVVTNNTDSYIGGNKQNYYLYEEDGVFSILPWDYNMAFGGMGGGMGMGRGGMAGGRGDTDDGREGLAGGGGDTGEDRGGTAGAFAGGIEQGSQWRNPSAENAAADASTDVSDRTDGITGNDVNNKTGNSTDNNQDKNTGENPAAPLRLPTGEAGEPSAINGNPAANALPGQSGTALLIDEPTQGALAERPLVAKLLAVDAYKEMYHNIIKEAIEGYLSEDSFSARVEQLKQMISEYVERDPTAFYTYEEYEQGVTELLATNAKQVDSIAQQLAGTIPSSGDGSGNGGMGGGMGGRFGAGAVPGIRNHVDAPASAGEQGANPVQSEQGAAAQQDVSPTQSEQEAPAQQGSDPPFGNPGAAPDGQAPLERDQGGRRAQDGMGLTPPEGFGNRGEFWGADQQGRQQQDNTTEAITAGISLTVLLAACAFVLYFRRKRL
ncbi:CotH kinase family protein [Paenibacillus woosongensis]|uniref:CotH kinase family protein n=1 Tax=Paenibacillus woosongensis TaxID=307580 RepID=A0AA95KWP7_9BACL|nr:CotH kinase family protein [Paenibacillus woosongensis]WHX49900.1 CotH kinase family protein [Paenibacillus woosongensis]